MKSCRCEQCNISSARYAWGFALLARDGWVVSASSELAAFPEGAWLCPACGARERAHTPSVTRATPVPGSRRGRPRSKLRILLVDDEDMVRRCTARTLSDFDVSSVCGGAEALALLEKDNDFDAVLSDVMMPRMSGPELYARCHELYPELAQRFVFASGSPELAREELSVVIERVNADQPPMLLAKPCSREGLVLALSAAAAHSTARSGTWAIGDAAREVTNYRG